MAGNVREKLRCVAQHRGQQHDGAPQREKDEGIAVRVGAHCTAIGQAQRPNDQSDVEGHGHEPVEDRARRDAVNPLRVAKEAEHAQHAPGVVEQCQPGRARAADAVGEDRDLGGVAEEELGVTPELKTERQEDQKRHRADDACAGQRAVPAKTAAIGAAPEHVKRVAQHDKGCETARRIGPHAEPGEQTGADQRRHARAAPALAQAEPERAKKAAVDQRHQNDADAVMAEVEMPEADRERQRGGRGEDAAVPAKQCADQHIKRRHGHDARKRRDQAQRVDIQA